MKQGMLLLSLLLLSYAIMAQQLVTGRILDTKTGTPLSGASIKIKGGRGTSTDNEGYFKIQATPGQTLEFTNVGYQNQVLVLGGETSLVIKLDPTTVNLAEMVVVGSRGA